MNNKYNCYEEGCSLPSSSNELAILINQLKREIKNLSTNTESKLLLHDGKIAEMCKYIKDNLSNSIRCLLDSMLLSGELDHIITETINAEINQKIYYIDTADKLKLTNYSNGSIIKTLGFKSVGDGGSALYKVREQLIDDSLDNGGLIALANHNVAELVKESDSINLKQLGCIGDGKTDFTNVFKYALNNYNDITIEDGTYIISDTLNVRSNTTIKVINAVIKSVTDINKKYIFNLTSVQNVSIKGINATLEFNKPNVVQQACISIANSENVIVDGFKLSKAGGDGITLGGSHSIYSKNIEISNCIMDNNHRQGISIIGGVDGCLVDHCRFTNTGNANPGAGIDIETWLEDLYNRNITIQNCYFKGNFEKRGILVFEYSENIEIINNNFDDESIQVKLNTQFLENTNAIPRNIVVKNNLIKGSNINFMNLKGDFDISNNYMSNGARIFLQTDDKGNVCETQSPSSIINNTIDSNNKVAVYLEGIGNITIKGNTIKNCSLALNTIGCRNVEFKDNFIYNYNKDGLQEKIFEILTTEKIVIEGNTLIKNDSTPIKNVLVVQASVRNLIFRRNNLIKCNFTNLLNGYSGAGLEGITYDNITSKNINESINLYLPTASVFYSGCIVQKEESGIIINYICKYDSDSSSYKWIKL